MRRRRLGLLLVLVPATLGPATAAFIWSGSGSDGQAFWLTPTLEKAPRAEHEPISSNPAAIAGEGGADTSAASGPAAEPSDSQPTSIESAPGEQASPPAHVDPGEAIGMPLLANIDTTQSTAAPSISSRFGLASIGTHQSSSTQPSGDSSSVADLRIASVGGPGGGAAAIGSGPVKPGKGAADDSYGDTPSAADMQSVDAGPNAPDSSSSDPMSSALGGSGPASGRDSDIQSPLAPSGSDAGAPQDETNPPQGDSLLPQNNSNLSGGDTNPLLDDTHPPDTNPNGGGDGGQSTPPRAHDPFENESGDFPEHEATLSPVQVPEPASLGLMIVALLGCAACRRRP